MHDSVLVNFTSGCWRKSALYNNWFWTIEKVEETTSLSVIGYGSEYATTTRAKNKRFDKRSYQKKYFLTLIPQRKMYFSILQNPTFPLPIHFKSIKCFIGGIKCCLQVNELPIIIYMFNLGILIGYWVYLLCLGANSFNIYSYHLVW